MPESSSPIAARQVSQNGRLAGFGPGHLPARRIVGVPGEACEAAQRTLQNRVIERVAHRAQSEDGVDPGRLDTAPAAVGFLTVEQPALGLGERATLEGADVVAIEEAQGAVDRHERAFPGEPLARRRDREAGAVAGPRPELGHGGAGRQARRGAQRHDHRDPDDRRPRPGGEFVEVDRKPAGQEVEPGRHGGQTLPVVLAEQGEPDFGEDAGGGDAALLDDPFAGALHVRRVGLGRPPV